MAIPGRVLMNNDDQSIVRGWTGAGFEEVPRRIPLKLTERGQERLKSIELNIDSLLCSLFTFDVPWSSRSLFPEERREFSWTGISFCRTKRVNADTLSFKSLATLLVLTFRYLSPIL